MRRAGEKRNELREEINEYIGKKGFVISLFPFRRLPVSPVSARVFTL